MPSSILYNAAAFCGILTQVAHGYTQVNVNNVWLRKNIDPIVFPGQYDKSHMHSFFGGDAVTINTNTSAELQKGCTNAENLNDFSAYWVPTPLYTTDAGKTYTPVPLSRFSAYYNLGETPAEISFPQDLKMVAGSATATTEADMKADAKSEWFCENTEPAPALDKNGFPSSTYATHLQQLLYFPQCVNEHTLETAYKSRDHGTENWCPTGMKRMPQLRFSIRWDLRKALPNGWSGEAPLKLACGPAWCSHGDFINGWTEETAESMIASTQEKQKFSGVEGKNKVVPSCTNQDTDPTHGTSDYAESVKAMSKRSVSGFGWESRARIVRL